MAKPHEPVRSEELAALRAEMERRRAILDTIKIAYMHSTPFGSTVPSAEDVGGAAKTFIAANYSYQRARYGKVRVKLSAANLLR